MEALAISPAQGRGRRPTLALSRVTRVLLLVVLTAVTSAWSLAWVAPCSAHEQATTVEAPQRDSCCPKTKPAPESPAHDERHCTCPIDCGPCCGGMPPSTLMTVPAVSPVLLLDFTVLTFPASVEPPAEGAAHDILHVPRG